MSQVDRGVRIVAVAKHNHRTGTQVVHFIRCAIASLAPHDIDRLALRNQTCLITHAHASSPVGVCSRQASTQPSHTCKQSRTQNSMLPGSPDSRLGAMPTQDYESGTDLHAVSTQFVTAARGLHPEYNVYLRGYRDVKWMPPTRCI